MESMNLFRLFNQMRGDEEFKVRIKLLDKLKNSEYFTEEDVNGIFVYKKMEYHSNQDAKKITAKVFSSQDLGEKFRLLKRLNGVGIVMASNILMFQNPRRYAEINHISWNILIEGFNFKESEKECRSDYSIQEYEHYLSALKFLADEYGMNVGDVEYALSHTR
jgi:hypothetical protein